MRRAHFDKLRHTHTHSESLKRRSALLVVGGFNSLLHVLGPYMYGKGCQATGENANTGLLFLEPFRGQELLCCEHMVPAATRKASNILLPWYNTFADNHQ